MRERRKNSKMLPELFLSLQIVAMFLFSYVAYVILLSLGVPESFLLAVLMMGNVIYLMKFHHRYIEVKNRTKYMRYN